MRQRAEKLKKVRVVGTLTFVPFTIFLYFKFLYLKYLFFIFEFIF